MYPKRSVFIPPTDLNMFEGFAVACFVSKKVVVFERPFRAPPTCWRLCHCQEHGISSYCPILVQ